MLVKIESGMRSSPHDRRIRSVKPNRRDWVFYLANKMKNGTLNLKKMNPATRI